MAPPVGQQKERPPSGLAATCAEHLKWSNKSSLRGAEISRQEAPSRPISSWSQKRAKWASSFSGARDRPHAISFHRQQTPTKTTTTQANELDDGHKLAKQTVSQRPNNKASGVGQMSKTDDDGDCATLTRVVVAQTRLQVHSSRFMRSNVGSSQMLFSGATETDACERGLGQLGLESPVHLTMTTTETKTLSANQMRPAAYEPNCQTSGQCHLLNEHSNLQIGPFSQQLNTETALVTVATDRDTRQRPVVSFGPAQIGTSRGLRIQVARNQVDERKRKWCKFATDSKWWPHKVGLTMINRCPLAACNSSLAIWQLVWKQAMKISETSPKAPIRIEAIRSSSAIMIRKAALLAIFLLLFLESIVKEVFHYNYRIRLKGPKRKSNALAETRTLKVELNRHKLNLARKLNQISSQTQARRKSRESLKISLTRDKQFAPVRHKLSVWLGTSRLLLLLLLSIVVVQQTLLVASSQLLSSDATLMTSSNEDIELNAVEPGDLQLWRPLLRRLYNDLDQRLADELAKKLANWPARHEAALFYLEQLARRLDSMGNSADNYYKDYKNDEKSSSFCMPVSLAQLMSATQWRSPLNPLDRPPNVAVALIKQVERDDLDQCTVWPTELVQHLRTDQMSSRLAQLAVDNANLITRLLLMDDRQHHRTKGQKRRATRDTNFLDTALRFSTPTGRLHRRSASSSSSSQPSDDTDLDQVESLLRHLVEPKLLNFMLEYKLNDFLAASSSLSPETRGKRRKQPRALHSIGLVLFADESDGREDETPNTMANWNSSSGDSNWKTPRLAYSRQAVIGRNASGRHQIKLFDLLQTGQMQPIPSAILKWWRLARSFKSAAPAKTDAELLRGLSERLIKTPHSTGAEDEENQDLDKDKSSAKPADLTSADGSWFSPYFQCGLSNRWLLTFSVPFFSLARSEPDPSRKRLQIRGVSYVNLDLASLGPLISQCRYDQQDDNHHNSHQLPPRPTPSFLVNTNQCHLIGLSQCAPLLEYFESSSLADTDDGRPHFRPGAYVCQCPIGEPRLRAKDRQANSAYQRRLIGLLWDQSGDWLAANSRWKDQLASVLIERDNVSSLSRFKLTNRQAVAELLLERTTKRPSERHFRLASIATANNNISSNRDLNAGPTTNKPDRRRTTFRSFVLGAELEFELALSIFARPTNGPHSAEANLFGLPRQACQACKVNGTNNGDELSSLADDSLECLSGENLEGERWSRASSSLLEIWIRPLVLVGQIVSIVVTLALIGVILRIRKSRTIIVSGWIMLETMLLGALLLHASVLVRYFQATSLTCLLEPWLRELGFSTFYGSILIKLYRILTEFQTRKAHRVCMRDKDQIIYLLAIVFIVIGYMSAWTALMVDGFFVRQNAGELSPLVYPSDEIRLTTDGDDDAAPTVSVHQLDQVDGGGIERSRRELSPIEITLDNNNNNNDRQHDRGQQRMAHNPLEALQSRHPGSLASDTGGEPNGRAGRLAPDYLTELLPKVHSNRDESTFSGARQVEHGSERPQIELAQRFVNMAAGGAKRVLELEIKSQWESRGTNRRKRELITSSAGLLNDHLEILARGLNSFGQLFLGLLETEQKYDLESDTFVYFIRCRKLTWDYVTESSEIALLLFGLHLVYKLRNASMEVNKEKLILGLAVLIELITSTVTYSIRHSFWHSLTSDHLLVLYALRCQLTATLTVVLVFGPKLWEIGKTRPGLLISALCGRWTLNVLFANCSCDVLSSSRSPAGAGSGQASLGSGLGSGGGGPQLGCSGSSLRGASVRHRCHISCEEHDHHLNDATRLHQAMLSNSALEIGSINLADMDPDEIQAELKRVYTQLELLKTKVMRRDNPHISKRRGGRKPGHRKFSLQAFHGRHSSSGTEQHNSQQQQQQQTAGAQSAHGNNNDPALNQVVTAVLGANANDVGELPGASKQQPSSIRRLPAVTELDGESSQAPTATTTTTATSIAGGHQDDRARAYMHTIKHVRLDEPRPSQEAHQSHKYTPSTRTANSSGKLSFSIVAKRSNAAASNHCGESAKWTPELPSTSSLGYDEDALMNDSQSSGEMTPQHRSSIIYNHQS